MIKNYVSLGGNKNVHLHISGVVETSKIYPNIKEEIEDMNLNISLTIVLNGQANGLISVLV